MDKSERAGRLMVHAKRLSLNATQLYARAANEKKSFGERYAAVVTAEASSVTFVNCALTAIRLKRS